MRGSLRRNLVRRLTVATACLGIGGALVGFPILAQTRVTLKDTHGLRTDQSNTKASAKRPEVTVVGKDSSVRWFVREVARQAGWTPSFYGESAALSRRVSVSLRDVDAMDALATILKGTDLVPMLSSDGQTLIIREEKPATKSTSAATGHITGVVIDSATRKGIPGVVVTIPKIRRSIVTQDAGTFRFSDIPTGEYTLSAKLLGYQSTTTPVIIDSGRTSTVQVVLIQTSATLSEVVTTAIGSQRRIEISNDVVRIDAEKMIESAPIQNVTDLLIAAQVPGMNITRSSGDPGAVARIRFGGPGSISLNNDPVVIVDGVWIKSAFSTEDVQRKLPASSTTSQSLPSRLDAIDPATIESIEIVRGPSAATLYGPDAANGVIKITTKRGQAGPTRWDFRGIGTWGVPTGTRPFQYYAYGRNEMSTAPVRCSVSEAYTNACILDSVTSFTPSDPFLRKEGTRFVNEYSLSVNGGANVAGRSAMVYNLTASMRDELGPARVPMVNLVRFRQLGIALNQQMRNPSEKRDRRMSTSLTLMPKAWYNVALNVGGSQMNSREDDIQFITTGTLGAFDTLTTLNRVVNVKAATSRTSSTSGLVNLNVNVNPWTWWNGNVTIGVDRGYKKENRVIPNKSCLGGLCTDLARNVAAVNDEYSTYTARVQSTFFPNLGWASRFLIIHPAFAIDLRRDVVANRGFEYNVNTDGAATQPSTPTMRDRVTALAGTALGVSIRLFDRFTFDPAIRRDFGSHRSLQNNEKTYPKFGTSWVVSDESFFPRQQFLSLLRVRMSTGFAAGQPNYAAIYGGYFLYPTVLDGRVVSRIDLNQIGNPNLQPERSFEIESGFDADLLNDRVTVNVTYINKQNKNTLIDRKLAPSTGVIGSALRQENVARVVNRSTMVALSGRVIDRPGLLLQLRTNLSVYDNLIKTLGDGVSPFGANEARYVAGYPVGGLWQRPVLALHDANANGILEYGELVFGDSVEYIGTNIPRITSGYSAELRVFNHITLNMMLNYKGGYVQNRAFKDTEMRGYWDPEAPLADQITAQLIAKSNDKDMQSVSELRMQSASVTVNVPPRFAKQLRARSLQISLQGSNLGLWTRYRGRDPGVNSSIVGERTTDNGFTIAPTRDFVLQIRLGY